MNHTHTLSKEDTDVFFRNHPNAGKYLAMPAFLSQAECEAFMSYSESDKLKTGVVNDSLDVDYKIRKNKIRFLRAKKYPELAWLFERINHAVEAFNDTNGLSPLKGLEYNAVQLGQYAKEDFYSWHQDRGPPVKRLVSFSIQLSPSDAYEGGTLQLLTREGVISTDKTIGTLSLFTSSTAHRIAPIMSGIRYSLVGWYV